MYVLNEADLYGALAAWGIHELQGLHGASDLPLARDSLNLVAVQKLLEFRSPMVSRVLESEPVRTESVRFEIADLDRFLMYDGRTPSSWTEELVLIGRGSVHNHVMSLVTQANDIDGPIECLQSPGNKLVVFDGSHRVAAWLIRDRNGIRSQTVSGYVVHTKNQVRLFSRPGSLRQSGSP